MKILSISPSMINIEFVYHEIFIITNVLGYNCTVNFRNNYLIHNGEYGFDSDRVLKLFDSILRSLKKVKAGSSASIIDEIPEIIAHEKGKISLKLSEIDLLTIMNHLILTFYNTKEDEFRTLFGKEMNELNLLLKEIHKAIIKLNEVNR